MNNHQPPPFPSIRKKLSARKRVSARSPLRTTIEIVIGGLVALPVSLWALSWIAPNDSSPVAVKVNPVEPADKYPSSSGTSKPPPKQPDKGEGSQRANEDLGKVGPLKVPEEPALPEAAAIPQMPTAPAAPADAKPLEQFSADNPYRPFVNNFPESDARIREILSKEDAGEPLSPEEQQLRANEPYFMALDWERRFNPTTPPVLLLSGKSDSESAPLPPSYKEEFDMGLHAALTQREAEKARRLFSLALTKVNASKESRLPVEVRHLQAILNNLALTNMRLKSPRAALKLWEQALELDASQPYAIAHNLQRLGHWANIDNKPSAGNRPPMIDLPPGDLRKLRELISKTQADTTTSVARLEGWGFLSLNGANNDEALVDDWCFGCNGTEKAQCPMNDCARGMVRDYGKERQRLPDGTTIERIRQTRVPCKTCKGTGFVACHWCSGTGRQR